MNNNRIFLLILGDGPNGIWYDTRNVVTKGPYLFCRTSHELLINFEIQTASKNSEVEPVYFIIFYRFSKTDLWGIMKLVRIIFLVVNLKKSIQQKGTESYAKICDKRFFVQKIIEHWGNSTQHHTFCAYTISFVLLV